MKYFLLRWTFILVAFHRSGDASRYLPMIVWDYRNLLLTCKCNWLTVPKIDIYDQFNFVCPTVNIAVGLMDGQSRSTSDMNENIFRRKVPDDLKNMENLTKALLNGTFCDPKHNDTDTIYTCKDGNVGKSFQVVAINNDKDKSKNYNKGDIVVFFNNNGVNGEASALQSLDKKCSMVFVVNITHKLMKQHDMSYGKHFNPETCKNGNVSCNYECAEGGTSIPTTVTSLPSTSTAKTSSYSTTESSIKSSTAQPTVSITPSSVTRCFEDLNLDCYETLGCKTNDVSDFCKITCTESKDNNTTTKQPEESCLLVVNSSRIYICNRMSYATEKWYCYESKDKIIEPIVGKRSSCHDDFKIPFIAVTIFCVVITLVVVIYLVMFVTSKRCKRKLHCKPNHPKEIYTPSTPATEQKIEIAEEKILYSNHKTENQNGGISNKGFSPTLERDGPDGANRDENLNKKDVKDNDIHYENPDNKDGKTI